jgi:putative transposase
MNWFLHLADARRTIESWRQDYNAQRPHSALGYRTPHELAALFTEAVIPLMPQKQEQPNGGDTPELI